ncbi:hypothetical protein C0Q70_08099 [Pomacea canaliculata]|uniref:G-protein coupled receptors family 1 profile domain-containing protein n=1 Tax=Pomacea canaliculata TaxID=400727 RepID=A0A2T7PGV6_POMCA|nr:hypothetical protein C0Q70_08099 [Pomacea canaliculata]
MDGVEDGVMKEIAIVNKTVSEKGENVSTVGPWSQNISIQSNIASECAVVMSLEYEQDIISRQTLEIIQQLKGVVLIPVIFVFGSASICLSLIVFYKHGLSSRINLCLFVLECINLINVTYLFVLNVDSLNMPFDTVLEGPVYEFLVNNNLTGLFGFGYAAVFLSALVACERCICVLFPLHSKTLISTQKMAVVIIVAICFIVFPRFIVTARYRIICAFDVRMGRTIRQLAVSEFYFQYKDFINVLDGTFYGIIVSLGGPIVTFVSTLITVFSLNQTIAFRQYSSTSDAIREILLTKMMIILSLENVLLSLPSIFLRIIPVFEPGVRPSGPYNNTCIALSSLVEISTHVNGSINFLVYYFAGTKFRKTVHSVFNYHSKRNRANPSSTSNSFKSLH